MNKEQFIKKINDYIKLHSLHVFKNVSLKITVDKITTNTSYFDKATDAKALVNRIIDRYNVICDKTKYVIKDENGKVNITTVS